MAETANKGGGLSRRTTTLLAILGVGAVVIALLVYERIDVLYLLATIALVALLAIVATSDLEKTKNIES
jgi:hypothetical protein